MPSVDAAQLRHVQLSPPEVKFIAYLADPERGGEVPWDWSKLTPEAKAMVAAMINKQLLIEREYVTDARQLRGELRLALTDQGRQDAEQLERLQVQPSG